MSRTRGCRLHTCICTHTPDTQKHTRMQMAVGGTLSNVVSLFDDRDINFMCLRKSRIQVFRNILSMSFPQTYLATRACERSCDVARGEMRGGICCHCISYTPLTRRHKRLNLRKRFCNRAAGNTASNNTHTNALRCVLNL
jgi:hypothetical protein